MWFYFSFADATRPAGSQFLGGCYVKVPEDPMRGIIAAGGIVERRGLGGAPPTDDEVLLAVALMETHRLGINPGGEAKAIGPVSDEEMDEKVPEADRGRLLSRTELLAP